MKRRDFLKALAALPAARVLVGVAAIAPPAKAACEPVAVASSGNNLLTIQEITREALGVLRKELAITGIASSHFSQKMRRVDGNRKTITVRRPLPYALGFTVNPR